MTALAERIRARIDEIYAAGFVRGEDDALIDLKPIGVTAERGGLLRELCLREHARTALEVGMATGLSALFILEALARNGAEAAAHVVIDPFQSTDYHRAGLRAVREAGCQHLVELHEQRSGLALPALLAQGRRFDFAFIDGSHRFDDAFVNLFYTHRMLKPGGVIVVDDPWIEDVGLVCQFAESNYGYQFLTGVRVPGNKQKPKPYGRPMISAYRKPAVEVDRQPGQLIKFYEPRWQRKVKRQSLAEALGNIRDHGRD